MISEILKLNITHLYPEEMNLYGDLGNVITLKKRCEWRGIQAEITNVGIGDKIDDLETDIYFFGGGQDKDQLRVYKDLVTNKKNKLTADLNDGVGMLAICGGYQLLGEYFLDGDGNRIEGIGILPLETVAPGPELKQRAIGNLATKLDPELGIENSGNLHTLVGFENHSGRTRINSDNTNIRPLGKVILGEGDNEDGHWDGIIYKNTIGSYMHGSLLPKNPHLADHLIKTALERKYNQSVVLKPLDDSEELAGHQYILKRYELK